MYMCGQHNKMFLVCFISCKVERSFKIKNNNLRFTAFIPNYNKTKKPQWVFGGNRYFPLVWGPSFIKYYYTLGAL